jgi:hypothetical protein
MIGKLLPMVERAFRIDGRPVPMCRKLLPETGWLVPMIANVSTETRKGGAMRGTSVPRPGRGFRKLVACHPWDGTSAPSSFFA